MATLAQGFEAAWPRILELIEDSERSRRALHRDIFRSKDPGAAQIKHLICTRHNLNSCNKVIVIKFDKLYYSESKLFNLKHKLCNNNMPPPSASVAQRLPRPATK